MTITIRQPWAEFVLSGMKKVENRSWRSTHTGVLLIHTAKKFDDDWEEKVPSTGVLAEAKRYVYRKCIATRGHMRWEFGCIAGAVIQHGCDTIRTNPWCENNMWYHNYAWPVHFEKTIAKKGRLKIFSVHLSPDQMATKDWRALVGLQKKAIKLGLTPEEETSEETE